MVICRSVFLCLEVGHVWRPLLRWPTLSPITWPPQFFSLCFCTSLYGGTVIHSLPRFIHWTPPANLLASFHLHGDTVLVVFRPASPRATDPSPQITWQKSPSTRHDTRHAAHSSLWQPCHNQHKSLSVSGRSKRYYGARREGREEGKGKADTLSTGRGAVISLAVGSGSQCECDCAHRTVRYEEG